MPPLYRPHEYLMETRCLSALALLLVLEDADEETDTVTQIPRIERI